MKKIIYTLAILVSSLIVSSCDVDTPNPNTLTPGTFWKTEKDAQYGIDAVYNMFYKPATYSRWLWFRYDLTSDEGFSQSPWPPLKEWTQFQYRDYTFREGNVDTYAACYQAIWRSNQVLTRVPAIAFANEDYKNQILAQAYFLRGLYYYNLALIWGSENKSLAINLEESYPAMRPAGHTGTEVFQQAISDFTEAQKYLPEVWDNTNKGRATKGAALAFRAKCYMQLHQWNDAKTDLQWLVTGDGSKYYDLVPNYADNFNGDGNNIESVFEIQYSDAHKAPADEDDYNSNPNLGLNRAQFFAPPGIGWNDGEMRPWLVDEFKKEKDKNEGVDIRLKSTAFYEGMEKDFADNSRIYSLTSDATTWGQSNWKGRVFIRKYASDYDRDFEDYHNPTNVRVIRYADVLLMYAECLAESGGSLADAVAQVDRVRARANMPVLAKNHPTAIASKEAFLKRLQMERTLELSTEGHRWADIKRWGLVDNQAGIDELKSRDADFNNFVIGRHACQPIPSDEVRNNKNIEQNPMY